MSEEDINKLVREHLGPGDGFGILCTHSDGVKLVRAALDAAMAKPIDAELNDSLTIAYMAGFHDGKRAKEKTDAT